MARIRTIKPEFWQNEDLASLSHHARLLAIALLNYADDEGCFLANAALVRAACFPFEEDSKNVLGSLQELSRIGYVEIRDCSGKTIGKVVKFLDHQRIDKAQKSKLSAGFAAGNATKTQENVSDKVDSTTIPRTFQEDSRNDLRLEWNGKGMEGNGKGEGEGKENQDSVSVFVSKRSESFQATWRLWKNHQRERFNVLTPTSEEMALMELERCFPGNESEQIKAIEFSIVRGAKNLITNGDHKRARAAPVSDPEAGTALGNSIIEKMYGGST